ncbi:hypothetical protein ILP97_01375 [Amycolatopsis sp. H6(2020)]|nr:hypothetical protein [Amycolatopsis sp. H6(2020)]
MAAAAAFLQRSVVLTADPARRTDRMLAAAEASFQAGNLEDVGRILSAVSVYPLDALQRGQAGMLRGQVAFATLDGANAAARTIEAARQLEPVAPQTARETYLTAWGIAVTFTDQATLLQVSEAVRLLPPPAEPGPLDLLLDGYAPLVTDGRAAAADTLRRAAAALVNLPAEQVLRWGWVATGVSPPSGTTRACASSAIGGYAWRATPTRCENCLSCSLPPASPAPGRVTSRRRPLRSPRPMPSPPRRATLCHRTANCACSRCAAGSRRPPS